MKRWWLWIALFLSLGVNVGVVATIAGHRAAARRAELRAPAPPPINALADRLGLEGARRDRFLQVQQEFFSEVLSRRGELQTLGRELRRELASRQPDRQRIDAILARMGDAYAGIDRAFADNVLASREILGRRQQRAFFRFLGHLRAGGERQRQPGRR